MFPIEVDLSMVRRQRETGMKGLGQVLKSFRDRSVDFSVYDRASGTDDYLNTLGPLRFRHKGHARVCTSMCPATPKMKLKQERCRALASTPLMGKTIRKLI